MSKNILFITEQLFVERTGASNAIDGKQLFPMIKVAQDIYIQPTLGSTLYKRLQNGIDNDDLTNDEKVLLDDYITDALIWYTMAMLPMTMGYQLFSKGFLQKTSEESQAPSRADLELIEAKYKSMAENYNTRMIKYLQQNYNLYYEYLNTTSGVDVIFPELKTYTCPIYIGDGVQRIGTFNSVGAYQQPYIAYYTATGGETNFNVALLVNRTPLLAFRGGLNKEIVTSGTYDTQKIQINNGVVTLPIGDVAMAGEIFTFSYR
jgi:hypothetical protein